MRLVVTVGLAFESRLTLRLVVTVIFRVRTEIVGKPRVTVMVWARIKCFGLGLDNHLG